MVYLPPSGPGNGGGGGGLLDRPTGVGPLCEFVPKDGGSADSKAAESETFQDFRNSLDVACEAGAAGEFGWVNWTVAANTPDLVYYQVKKNPARSQEEAYTIFIRPSQISIRFSEPIHKKLNGKKIFFAAFQSYNAFNRGWKIRVVDEGAPMNAARSALLGAGALERAAALLAAAAALRMAAPAPQ